MGKDTTIVDAHPSYGLVQFNRIQGSPKNLFGTHLQPQHFIELKVVKGERQETDGFESYYGKETLLRVWMSTTQFSECITSMDIGTGVPCTIRQTEQNRDVPYPPTQYVPTERVQAYFETRMKEFGKDVRTRLEDLETILNKEGAITKKDRETIRKSYSGILQEVESNIPYFLTRYEEAAQKIVTQAKTELDSFVTHAAVRIGLDQIAANGIEGLLPGSRQEE